MPMLKLKNNPAKRARVWQKIQEGVKYDAIAFEEGITNTCVSKFARKHGVFKQKERQPGKQDEIMAEVRSGKSYHAIAREMGLSRTYVNNVAKANGVNRGQGTGEKMRRSDSNRTRWLRKEEAHG
jgi:uncharacterized protein YerC